MAKDKKETILLHSCPRCRGDLFRDVFDDELVCLQCGRRTTVARLEESRKELALAA
jgi:uncharacterized Zn finger protein (UPF0148 family)